MLVLSRKCRQSVVVGGVDGTPRLLKVTVLDVSGGTVKLGFEADASVLVYRSEVWQRMDEAGELADPETPTVPPA
jgi:carbon storage regulator CsrA